ncbi:pyridoxal phosphate-dependent transferase [Umbelopsis sp. AD052]|nr:pyridoxal phosphate-dependent transferase [Umbelopsis sp. AD052]
MVFLTQVVSDARINETKEQQEEAGMLHEEFSTSVYGTRWAGQDIPRFDMPDNEMPPDVAYRLINDELALDGRPSLNLASFVTTFMEPEAEKLISENASKNFIDYEEYPQTCEIQNRCINMIARMFHAPMDSSEEECMGCSTIGSSEAIILAVLAMKRRWQIAREEKGLSKEKPNLVMGANVQVCWEKAVKYLEIEARYVSCTEDYLIMSPEKAMDFMDENTIGVCAILGSTYTGHYEDVKTLNDLLEKKCAETGWDICIHVDAASGGFVAPFVCPELVWDFRLPRVISINVSGHKYGLTYAGVGWCIWRSKDYLPKDLIFNINYLGADQASLTLNFSKSASTVIGQYYVLIRLGKSGFRSIMTNLIRISDHLAACLEKAGFQILSERNGRGLPLVAFRIKSKKHYDEFDVAARLRERGWIVPAYTAPPNAERIKMLRVVVREDFSKSRCDLLIRDILAVVKQLDAQDAKTIEENRNNHPSAKQRWALLRNIGSVAFHHPQLEGKERVPNKTNGVC